MIAALFYAVGLLVVCLAAMRHGALQVSVSLAWAAAVWVYAIVGAVVVRAVIRRGAVGKAPGPPRIPDMIKSAQRADAERRQREAQP